MVVAATTASLVTISDVHAHLNIPDTDTSHDGELQGFIDAAVEIVTFMVGPVLPTVFTGEVHNGGWPTVGLFNPPIISIQSVFEYIGVVEYVLTAQPLGSTVDNYGYSLDDPASGILVRRSGAGTPIPFMGGPRSVVVSYTAGLASVPADVRMATLEDIRGLYQQTQQGGRPAFGSSGAEDDGWNAGPVRLFPRLAEILMPKTRAPSIG